MADNVLVTSLTSGISIAAEGIGGVEYQRVKLVGGSIGDTTPVPAVTSQPAAASPGLAVWVGNPGGTVVASGTVSVSGNVAVSGTVSVSAMPAVSGTVSVNGSVSMSGTGLVSVVPGLSVSAQISGTVSVSALPAISGTVTANGSVSLSGTGLVSVVPGLSVSAVVSGTVSVLAGTISTLLGTAVVSVVPGLSVSAQVLGSVSLSGTGVISGSVAISGTGLVSVVPGLSVSAQVSGTVTVSNIAGGQVLAQQSFQTPFVFIVSSTVVGSSTTVLFTVYTGGTQAVAGTSAYTLPNAKKLRVLSMNIIAVSSAVLGNAQLQLLQGTVAASISVTATVGVLAILPYAIQASTTPFSVQGIAADMTTGTLIGLGIFGGTSHSILGAVIQGYIF